MAMNALVKQLSKLTQQKARLQQNCADLATQVKTIDIEIVRLTDQLANSAGRTSESEANTTPRR